MNIKAILTLIIFYISFINISYAQDFWEELYFPDSVSIRCLATNNEGHIFVGTGNNNETGGVYRSTDNAQSWEQILDNGTHGVLSIDINENGHIFIGKNGFEDFVVSYDNGESWEEIELPAMGNIVKILCVGQDTIYVSSWEDQGAMIIRSNNSGATWDTIFTTVDHFSEYASDIAISNNGNIYISLMCFMEDMGGIYKSENDAETWQYCGLLNHQVRALAINSNDDVFTGDWWVIDYNEIPGIYALYNGNDEFEVVLPAYHVTDMLINSEDHIYATANGGVVRSFNNGENFEYIDDTLSKNMGIMYLDNEECIYVAQRKRLARSINTTVSVNEPVLIPRNRAGINIYPNPVTDVLNVLISYETGAYKNYTMSIYEITGKNLSNKKITISEMQLQTNVSQLSPGIYYISLRNENTKMTAKFIKI